MSVCIGWYCILSLNSGSCPELHRRTLISPARFMKFRCRGVFKLRIKLQRCPPLDASKNLIAEVIASLPPQHIWLNTVNGACLISMKRLSFCVAHWSDKFHMTRCSAIHISTLCLWPRIQHLVVYIHCTRETFLGTLCGKPNCTIVRGRGCFRGCHMRANAFRTRSQSARSIMSGSSSRSSRGENSTYGYVLLGRSFVLHTRSHRRAVMALFKGPRECWRPLHRYCDPRIGIDVLQNSLTTISRPEDKWRFQSLRNLGVSLFNVKPKLQTWIYEHG